MTHLTDEQLDVILQGDGDDEHVARCPQCSARLAERQAVADRLRSAFGSVRASDELTEKIRRSVAVDQSATPGPPRRAHVRRGPFRWLMPLTAAAVVMLGALAAVLFLPTPESASAAAREELFNIHQHGLSPHTELYTDDEPHRLAEFLKNELGFEVAVPKLEAGMSLRGCCVTHFRDKPVGSYVVDTPRSVISVIVVTETLQSLGLTEGPTRGGRLYGVGSFAKCSMVSVKLNGYTYCAVGEVPHDYLIDLLEQLVQ